MNLKKTVQKLALVLLVVLLLVPVVGQTEEAFPLKLQFDEGQFSISWEARLVDTWEIPAESLPMLVISKVDESVLISIMVRGNYELLLWVDAQYADKISVSGALRALFVDASAQEWVTLELGDDTASATSIAINEESLAGLFEKSTYVPLFPGNSEDTGSTGSTRSTRLPCGHARNDAGDHSVGDCGTAGHYNCDGNDHSAAACAYCGEGYYNCDAAAVASHSADTICSECANMQCFAFNHADTPCGIAGHYTCDPTGFGGPRGHGLGDCGTPGHYSCTPYAPTFAPHTAGVWSCTNCGQYWIPCTDYPPNGVFHYYLKDCGCRGLCVPCIHD